MRRSDIGLPLTLVAVLGIGLASPSAGVELDVNILGVYTDTTFNQLDSAFWVSPDGDQAVADLQQGQGVLVGIDVANVDEDFVRSIFATLRVDSTRIGFLSGSADSVLIDPGFGGQTVPPIHPVDVKLNSPGGTNEWIQALLHHLSAGTIGPGPDINAVELFFEVPASVGTGPIEFTLDLTEGDGIQAGDEDTFDNAVLFVPEPSLPSALVVASTALALAARSRRSKAVSRRINRSIVQTGSSTPFICLACQCRHSARLPSKRQLNLCRLSRSPLLRGRASYTLPANEGSPTEAVTGK